MFAKKQLYSKIHKNSYNGCQNTLLERTQETYVLPQIDPTQSTKSIRSIEFPSMYMLPITLGF